MYINCFHPSRCIKKKYGGVWKDCYDNLIPGYVFLQCDNIDEFYKEAKKNQKHLNILGKNFDSKSLDFYELTKEEEGWLKKLVGIEENGDIKKDAVAEISKIDFDENDKVVVLSGPLKDLTGYVKRINLHKRIAEVEMEFMGRKTVIILGIDWVVKSKEETE